MQKGGNKVQIDIGTLVWVNFPYEEDPTKSKLRPACVVEI